MIAGFSIRPSAVWICCVVLALAVDRASACSVCFGDPESSMAKGAAAGVWVLAGIISFVLAGVAGMSLFWLGRARRLATLDHDAAPSADRSGSPESDGNGD